MGDEYSCRNCQMKFRTAKELANHKQRLQEQLKRSQVRPDIADATRTTFDEVKMYIKSGVTSDDAQMGKMTLSDLRRSFQSNEEVVDSLRRQLLDNLENEKVEQLKTIQAQAAAVRFAKEEDERELLQKMKELEAKTAAELRARDEKEQAKRTLWGVDRARLADLERDKKRQVELLERERDEIRQREINAQRELTELQQRILQREEDHRRQQEALQKTVSGVDTRKQQDRRDELTVLARKQGEQMAHLQSQRAHLLNERKQLDLEQSRLKSEGAGGDFEHEDASSLADRLQGSMESDLKRLAALKQRHSEVKQEQLVVSSMHRGDTDDLDFLPQRDKLVEPISRRFGDALEAIDTLQGNTKAALESVTLAVDGMKGLEGVAKLEQQKAAVLEMQRRLKEERKAIETRQADVEEKNAQKIAQLEEEKSKLTLELQDARTGVRPTSRNSLHSSHLDMPRPPAPPSGALETSPPPFNAQLTRDPLPPITPTKTVFQQMRPASSILEEIQALAMQVQRGTADASVLARITDLERQLNEPSSPSPYPVQSAPPMGMTNPYNPMQMMSPYGMMAPPTMSPWLAPQMSLLQQQMQQMDLENKRLVEEIRAAEERRKEQLSMSRTKDLERAISSLATRVGGSGRGSLPTTVKREEEDRMSPTKSIQEDIDPQLRELRAEHQREMERMKFEMERLEQAQRLEKLRHEMEQDKKATEVDNSITMMWDFITGLPSDASAVSVVYAVYDGAVARTPVRRTAVADAVQGKSVVAQQRVFPPMPLLPRLKLIVEIQASLNGARPVSLGWTMMEIVDSNGVLRDGWWRLPMYRSVPEPSLAVEALGSHQKADALDIYVRLVRAGDRQIQGRANPDNAAQYSTLEPARQTHQPSVPAQQHNPSVQPPNLSTHTPFTKPQQPAVPPAVRVEAPQQPPSLVQPPSAQPPSQPEYSSSVKPTDVRPLTPPVPNPPGHNPDVMVVQQPPSTSGGLPAFLQSGQFTAPGTALGTREDYNPKEGVGVWIQHTISFSKDTSLSVQVTLYDGPNIALRDGGLPFTWSTSFEEFINLGKVSWNQRSTFDHFYPQSTPAVVCELIERKDGQTSSIGWACTPIFAPSLLSAGGRHKLLSGRLELTLYKNPVVLPPVGASKLTNGKLVIAIFSPTSTPPDTSQGARPATSAVPLPRTMSALASRSGAQTSELWLPGQPLQGVTFKRGDGFDVYIDFARHLPDSTTITRVNAIVMTRGNDVIGNLRINEMCHVDGSAFCPVFAAKGEFRGDFFDPTATLYLQVCTVESLSREVKSIGFAVHNIFVDGRTGSQPRSPTAQDVQLNAGAIQLRLRRNGLPPGKEPSLTCLDSAEIVNCATVFVRILPAQRHVDGSRFVSVTDYPDRADQISHGAWVTAPHFSSGLYFSDRCIPTASETKMFAGSVGLRPSVPLKNMLPIIKKEEPIPDNDVELTEWCKRRFPIAKFDAPPIDYNLMCRYQPSVGFKIAVDLGRNMPVTNGFVKAIYSITPPGAYYLPTPLTMGVHYTFDSDLDSDIKNPRWRDGWKVFNDAFDQFTCVIVDVRAVIPGKVPTMTQIGWGALPVFGFTGHVLSGSYWMPLFQGNIPGTIMDALKTRRIGEVMKEHLAQKRIKPVEWSCILVRILDCQRDGELEDIAKAEANASSLWIPQERVKAYLSASSSKPQITLSTLRDKDMALRVVNRDFAKMTDIATYNSLLEM